MLGGNGEVGVEPHIVEYLKAPGAPERIGSTHGGGRRRALEGRVGHEPSDPGQSLDDAVRRHDGAPISSTAHRRTEKAVNFATEAGDGEGANGKLHKKLCPDRLKTSAQGHLTARRELFRSKCLSDQSSKSRLFVTVQPPGNSLKYPSSAVVTRSTSMPTCRVVAGPSARCMLFPGIPVSIR